MLVGLQACTTTLEISMVVLQKIGHSTVGESSNTSPGHSSLIYNRQKLERTHISEEWIQEMWYIYTMEYYGAIKNNEFMKFLGKWIQLENIVLS